MTGEHSRLEMARGDDALTVPPWIVETARSVDRELASDLAIGERLARQELDELCRFEHESGQRVHKGHALHSIGVTIVARDPVAARTYFHAARVEDTRTYPDGTPEGWGQARQVLVELYGERVSAIEELEDMARETVSDPMTLAAEFERDQGADLGMYVGLRAASRDESNLDGVDRRQLVFVAGTHAFPHHIKALRDAVTDLGLTPVVVLEYPSRPDDTDYSKSERLMSRCGCAVFDLSYLQGQMLELPLAVRDFHIPLFAGFIEGSVTGVLHGTGMVRGLLQSAGVEPESVINTEQLREAARAWLRRYVPSAPSAAIRRGTVAPDLLAPTGGTASPYGHAIGSNTPFVYDGPGPVPSGEGYIADVDPVSEPVNHRVVRLRSGGAPEPEGTESDDGSRPDSQPAKD